MSRVFFARPLDTAATYWRICRADGVALGFTTHDRDLWFDGLLHRCAPGLTPSSIRRTADLADDAVDIKGALAHDTLAAEDLAAGRFDGAQVVVGVVDWQTLEHTALYGGTIGAIAGDGDSFTAELHSAKTVLDTDPVPRTSPTCRARFCGPGCNLPPAMHEREAVVERVDLHGNAVAFAGVDPALYEYGEVRWIDGPHRGQIMALRPAGGNLLACGTPLSPQMAPGHRALIREGCDHRLETCAGRFGNAVNFQGEPFLPGNDLLAQYPVPR